MLKRTTDSLANAAETRRARHASCFKALTGPTPGTLREAASRDGSQPATRPTGEYVLSLVPSLSLLGGGDRPGERQEPLTPNKGAGGGAPSLIAAEVGHDRSQPPCSAFGAAGRGHQTKKKKKKKTGSFRQAAGFLLPAA